MLVTETHTVQPMPGTNYPALRVACLSARRPTYVLTNVVLPMCILTALALLQFLLPGHHDAAGVRITFTVTILLTSATYKLFVSTALPAVGYLTLCDKYVLACFVLACFVRS